MTLRTRLSALAIGVLLCAGSANAQQTCLIPQFSATATGRSATYDNRNMACTGWRLAYYSEGFSVVSIELDAAPDVSGAPGSWTAIAAGSSCTITGTNPLTAITSDTSVFSNCNFPWISIKYTLTGTGTTVAGARGVGGVAATSITGGGGSGSGITGLTGDGTATGPGNVPLTLATVNGAPGACGDSTHVCQITTNGKGLTTGQTAVAIAPGSGITALTGDATATGPGSAAITFSTVNAGPGACGDATHVCQVTTNAKGLVTTQTPVAISGGGGTPSAKSVSIPMLSVDSTGGVTVLNTVGGGPPVVNVLSFFGGGTMTYQYVIPTTWDGSAISIRLWVLTSSNGTGNFSFKANSAPGGNNVDYGNLVYTSGSTTTVAAPGGAGSGFYAKLVTVAVPLTGLVAGNNAVFQVQRGGADTYAATLFGTSAEIVITY